MKRIVFCVFVWLATFGAYANCGGRILHAGAGKICIRESIGTPLPALCAGMENRKYCVPLTPGNVGRLHVLLNNEVYSVPDFMESAEYVRFDGASYIDLGFVPTTDLNFEIRADLDSSVASRDGALLGARNTMSDQYVIWYNTKQGANTLAPRLFTAGDDLLNSFQAPAGPITMRWENNVFTVNDVAYDIVYFTHTVNQTGINLHLGALAGKNNVDSRRFLGDVYYARFWNDGGVIMDLVAATDADGVPGMYDKVSGRMMYLKR